MFTAAAEPLCGYNTCCASEDVYTYPAELALIAYDAVTAYEAVNSDPDANGYTFNTLIL